MELLKLNLGGGPKKLEGYLNVDALPWDGKTDIVHDLTVLPYPFESNSIDEILAVEFVEHISFRHINSMLLEWKRIMKTGGKLSIQVPDCGNAMRWYAEGKICACVKHKPVTEDDAKADPKCPNCEGRAKINPQRWLFSFCGAQKHKYDFHLNIFSKASLEDLLIGGGFREIVIKSDKYGWKLIANAIK